MVWLIQSYTNLSKLNSCKFKYILFLYRYKVGTALANAIQQVGYKGEVGYQTFLYWNESEIRKVFMFLLEKMPKETSQMTEETLGKSLK